MSVSNPVDSGGGLIAFDRDLQGLADQMNTVGGWAAMMDQDSINNTIDEEEPGRDEEDGRNNRMDEQSVISSSHQGPPYALQVLNVPEGTDSDELYLFLGGDEKIEHSGFELKKTGGRANVVFKTAAYMDEFLSVRTVKFGTQLLRFFKLPEPYQEPFSRKNSYQQSRDSRDYNRPGSNYGSTASLASSHYGGQGRRYDHGSSRDYQTMPPPGKYRDDRSMRGSYRKSFRGEFHGGYDRRSNYGGYGGDIQRSESYTYDKERPAPINRSRTEDGIADRRQSDLLSRTSSQYSVDQDDSKPVVKKPSTKDIFGEAKPADTAQKIKEFEERQAEKRKEAEKLAERNQQQQQLQQQQQHQQQQHQHQQHQHQQMAQSHPPMGYGCPQVYQQPPPNYIYQPCMQPTFITPMVGLGPGGPAPQQYMRTPPPAYAQEHQASYYRGPGSVRIAQRSEVDVNANSNISPPQDPEHPRQTVPQSPTVDHPINTIKEEPIVIHRRPSASQESNKSSAAHSHEKPANQSSKPFVRTFNNSSHKTGPFESGRGNRGGRGFPRGRGGGTYHATKTDSTATQGADVQEKVNKEASRPSPADNNNHKKNNKAKDIHGSQASLNSHGGTRGGGANRGRGRGNFRNRPMRDDRASREDSQKSEIPKEQKLLPQRKHSKGEGQKNSVSVPSKTEPKKEELKQEPVPVSKTDSVTPTVSLENKEKKKKKKPNLTKNLTPLNNNKFAALANDTGDD